MSPKSTENPPTSLLGLFYCWERTTRKLREEAEGKVAPEAFHVETPGPHIPRAVLTVGRATGLPGDTGH